MSTYVVKAVKQVKDGSNDNGPWTVQKLRLITPDTENGITDVEMFCGKFQRVPSPGDEVEGEIGPGKFGGLEFKPARKGGGGQSRPEDPKKMASIRRMHAHKTALELVRLGLETSLITKPENFGDLLTSFYQQVDELDADAKKAAEKA